MKSMLYFLEMSRFIHRHVLETVQRSLWILCGFFLPLFVFFILPPLGVNPGLALIIAALLFFLGLRIMRGRLDEKKPDEQEKKPGPP